jgi:hypothetical protein
MNVINVDQMGFLYILRMVSTHLNLQDMIFVDLCTPGTVGTNTVKQRVFCMIYSGPRFARCRMIWLLPHPPSSVSKLYLFLCLPVCRRSSSMTGPGGGGG